MATETSIRPNPDSSDNSEKDSIVPTLGSVIAGLQENLEELQAFNIQSLAIFGSVARGEATTDSDLDFLVEFEGRATFDGYMGLKFFLEDLFHRSVDLVIKGDLKEAIRQSVIEESIYVA